MKKFVVCAIAMSLAFAPAQAKKKPKKGTPPVAAAQKDTVKPYVVEGLFTVTKKADKWFFTIPDSLLGRPILAVTRFIATPVDAGTYGGEMANNRTVYWEKNCDGKLVLRALILDAKAKSADDKIAQAVRNSAEDPIIGIYKVESKEKGGYKIEVTNLFLNDTEIFSIPTSAKRDFKLGGYRRDASFINSIHSYPINTEVSVTRTYGYNAPDLTRGLVTGTILPGGYYTGSVSVQLNTSFVLLPKEPMQSRKFDPRVGYFADSYAMFSDEQQKVESNRFICRWRLEAKNAEDAARQQKGELIEPKKPIVYYIDPATPKQWVPYLKAGVNDWNVAFEQAGWKNAIRAEEWPNDSTMSLEDARFSVIRYLASDIANAYGPNVHDPRSGEILESHIGWYHNVMTLVHDWYQTQAGPLDPRARSAKFSDELMGDLIRFVSSHEVGHTLGLRHNMGASHFTPVEKLRDKAWVEKHGHTVSIMDYARFNYVAQPEDNISKEGIYPRIGEYDKWAIEYGYKPNYNTTDPEEDHKFWNKEIIARLKKNPALWFGGEGRNQDPRAQTEDLGDNAMKASTYGIMNLKRVVKALPEWTKEEADQYSNIKSMMSSVIGQFNRYVGHVSNVIGGRYETFKSIEQSGVVYEAVPRSLQKEAIEWLGKNVYKEPKWLISEKYVYDITDSPVQLLSSVVNRAVSGMALFNATSMERMQQFAEADASNYSPAEYIADLNRVVFTEAGTAQKVGTYRRLLQRAFVKNLISALSSIASDSRDGHSFLVQELSTVYSKARTSAKTAGDAVSRAHWTSLAQMIDKYYKK